MSYLETNEQEMKFLYCIHVQDQVHFLEYNSVSPIFDRGRQRKKFSYSKEIHSKEKGN